MAQSHALQPVPEQDFAREVHEGLSAAKKYLPTKYLYDATGDDLFSRIMFLPEYYLSRCETEILTINRQNIIRQMASAGKQLKVVELGAGDGYKTRILLQYLMGQSMRTEYIPVDISAHVLEKISKRMNEDLPGVNVKALCMQYEEALDLLSGLKHQPKLILFLGSSIGNYSKDAATTFLKSLSSKMNEDDRLLIGFDLKKDPAIICRAYNDKEGVTREFNFNLLRRINRELQADFRIENFQHYPVYDPATGEMKSYLLSLCDQEVKIVQTGHTYHFSKWESVFVEVSMKYTPAELRQICEQASLTVVESYSDKNSFYVNLLLKKSREWKLTALK